MTVDPLRLAAASARRYLVEHRKELMATYCQWSTIGKPIRATATGSDDRHLREVEQIIADIDTALVREGVG